MCVCVCVFVCRLLNSDGSLLAFSGQTEKEAKVFAAIASNIWLTYEKSGKAVFDSDIEHILIQNEVWSRARTHTHTPPPENNTNNTQINRTGK